MPRLTPQAPTPTTDAIPDRAQVVGACRNLLQIANRDPDFAQFFVEHVAAPAKANERPHRTSTIGGGTRWEFPYYTRILQSLSDYLAMSDKDRQLLHAGLEDGVQWRGESITQYLDIADKTLRMRDMGVSAYRQDALKALTKLEQKARRESRRAGNLQSGQV